MQQLGAVFVRRIRQFLREPRIWICLVAPFITALVSFLIINNINPSLDDVDPEAVVLVNGVMFSMWMLIGFALCAGLFIVGMTYDREWKLRYLMNFAGLRTLPYVLGNTLADFTLFMVPTVGFIAIMIPMDLAAFQGSEGELFAIMCCFGFSMIALTYLIGYMFVSTDKAFRMLGTAYACVGFVVPVALTGFLVAIDDPTTKIVINALFYIDPFYPFYLALMWVCVFNLYGDDDQTFEYDVFFPGFKPYTYITCPAMLFMGIVYLLIAIFIDFKQNAAFRTKDETQSPYQRPFTLPPDQDVKEETEKIK
mmetsp:Transcript_12154/g.8839  ORF Transcript_12154/g.8839 Transcript_12154/m.8839 type:complete len:309 (-) Transcript_12154:1180-2106(-)